MGELAYLPNGVDNTGGRSHRIGWNSTIAHCNIVFIYMFRGGNQICPRYGSAHEQLNIARHSQQLRVKKYASGRVNQERSNCVDCPANWCLASQLTPLGLGEQSSSHLNSKCCDLFVTVHFHSFSIPCPEECDIKSFASKMIVLITFQDRRWTVGKCLDA